MYKNNATVVFLVAMLVATAVPVSAWTGSLSTSDGGLHAENGWAPAFLSWDITQPQTHVWRYEYTLGIDATGGISHMDLETSSHYTPGFPDIYNLERWDGSAWVGWNPTLEIKWHKPGSGNPLMPDVLYGIKFELEGDYTQIRWRFDANRYPVWGDFYAKDGGGKDNPKVLWNEGFARDDPTVAAHDGTNDNHILRPNSRTPELPPCALLALGSLPLGLAYVRGRWRRKKD